MNRPPLTDAERAIAQTVRETILDSTDEQLDAFLAGYSLGNIAGFLVSCMSDGVRAGFLGLMLQRYPEAFGRAVCAQPGSFVTVPLVNGFYWIRLNEGVGGAVIAERFVTREGPKWLLPGLNENVRNDGVMIVAGPVTPPPAAEGT